MSFSARTARLALFVVGHSAALSLLSGCLGPEISTSPPLPPPSGSEVTPCEESETKALAKDVYSFRRGLYSTMFVVGKSGIIAFDPLGQEASCLSRAIQLTAPGLKIQHLLYSHGASDHVAGGSQLPLAPGVKVYAHREAVADMLRRGKDPAILPVTDALDVGRDGSGMPYKLNLLGQAIDLYYFGPTRSTGNLVIHLPDKQVAMLVDVVMARTAPGTVLASLSPQGVLRTLGALEAISLQHLVVGHGPPAGPEDVSGTLAFWSNYIAQAGKMLQKTTITVSDKESKEGAPLLSILPKLPVTDVLDALRPTYGKAIGFEDWGSNGMHFSYVYLQGETWQPVALRPLTEERTLMPRWEKVGLGAYHAQVGGAGSLVLDLAPGQPLVVVDPLGEHALHLRRLIMQAFPGRKVGHIIYTHAHNDRVAHAKVLCDGDLTGVKIYAHENAARDLRLRKNPDIALPTVVFAGDGEIQVGDKKIQLFWYGPDHTDGNLIVYVPSAQVAMGVDLLQKGAAPGLLSVAMDPAGLSRTLSAMSELPAQVYLTGQGGVFGRTEFREAVSAARDLLSLSAAAMRDGDTGQGVSLKAEVAPALRSYVVQVGEQVSRGLMERYPALLQNPAGRPILGELGVTYCSSQVAVSRECEVR